MTPSPSRIRSLTIQLTGDLGPESRADLEAMLFEAEARQPELLLADVSDVSSIDWSALTVLLKAKRRARAEGRRMQIVDGADPARRLFQAVGRERADRNLRGMLSSVSAR